ncbi:hypothetical protein [Polluticoccus soli]|uniref:hypothetical protein n=1 Tax=Polluticoccus soli TaxID=3034150 RepID=UPI0023E20AC8|nr:hypothetical protein [Flavipsychrobacter sp. JY13-12]
MKKLAINAAAVVLLLAGCNKKETVTAESILLLANHGYSLKPTTYYKITGDGVMEDTLVVMNNEDVFDTPVPAEKSVRAKELLTKITRGMLDKNGKEYHSKYPDAGGSTITATVSGKTYRWYITDDVEALPKYFRDFGQAVNEAVNELEQ